MSCYKLGRDLRTHCHSPGLPLRGRRRCCREIIDLHTDERARVIVRRRYMYLATTTTSWWLYRSFVGGLSTASRSIIVADWPP